MIKTLLSEKDGSWDEHLSRAVIAYNNTPHTAISMSPSKYLITKNHHHFSDPPLQSQLKQYWKVGHPSFLPFKLSDKVLMKVQHKGFLNVNKFLPKFEGPYKVVKVDSYGVSYQLLDETNNKTYKAHHSKLKIFKEIPLYISRNPLYCELSLEKEGESVDSANEETYCTLPDNMANLSWSSDSEDLVDSDSSDSECSVTTKCSSYSDEQSSGISVREGEEDLRLESTICCEICKFEESIESSLSLGSRHESPGRCQFIRYGCDEPSMSDSIIHKTPIDVTHRFLPSCEIEFLDNPGLCIDRVADDLGVQLLDISTPIRSHTCSSQESSVVFFDTIQTTPINLQDALDWQLSYSDDTDFEFDNLDDPRMPREVLEGYLERHIVEESFVGFEDSFVPGQNLSRLNEIRQSEPTFGAASVCTSDTKMVRHTRSMGPVETYENVQSRVLEHKNRDGT